MKDNQDIAIELARGLKGGFMAALGDAYCCADNSNRRRLELAFPHVFKQEGNQVVYVAVTETMAYGPFYSKDAMVVWAGDSKISCQGMKLERP